MFIKNISNEINLSQVPKINLRVNTVKSSCSTKEGGCITKPSLCAYATCTGWCGFM